MKHKIIQTENYLLVVDEDTTKAKEGYWIIRNGIEPTFCTEHFFFDFKEPYKKIIAHLPLNNSPILDGVDLLPLLEDEDDVEKLAKQWCLINNYNSEDMIHSNYINYIRVYQLFIQGYNKAKEKYKYTEEDLRDALYKMYSLFMSSDLKSKMEVLKKEKDISDKIIQSLQQPKMPIEFDTITIDNLEETITNSQGFTQWVGKYIF
jgi:hypothetical protein